jgi:transposase-like protein
MSNLELEYQRNHILVRETRGPAWKQKCVDCGAKAYAWSWIHETDPTDVNNYEPRCGSCHSVYDGYTERRKFTPEQAEQAKKLVASGLSHRKAAKILGISHQIVGRIIKDSYVGGAKHVKRSNPHVSKNH